MKVAMVASLDSMQGLRRALLYQVAVTIYRRHREGEPGVSRIWGQ